MLEGSFHWITVYTIKYAIPYGVNKIKSPARGVYFCMDVR